jgi:hypothetical protein
MPPDVDLLRASGHLNALARAVQDATLESFTSVWPGSHPAPQDTSTTRASETEPQGHGAEGVQSGAAENDAASLGADEEVAGPPANGEGEGAGENLEG